MLSLAAAVALIRRKFELCLQLPLRLYQRYRTFLTSCINRQRTTSSPSERLSRKKQYLVPSSLRGSASGQFLHYTCLVTFKQRKMSKYNADPAFVRECQIAFNMLLSGIRGKQMSVASERSIFSENHCYKGLFVSRSTRTYLYFRV